LILKAKSSREIPRPAGENAGFRDDARREAGCVETKLTHHQKSRELATIKKAGLSRPSPSIFHMHMHMYMHKLLLRGDCVLGSLGDAELYHRLCLDLNGLAGLRITSDAGFAVRFH
jgi:hypothetical protein